MFTEEQEKEIRNVTACLTNLLIQNNREKAEALEKRIREHPEEFFEEFLKEHYGEDR